ncbi:MAG: AAA family ATPase [Nocardioidaceae bacterium]
MTLPTVLVTGVPGSGKTTLARSLSRATRLPLLSLDSVKEAMFETHVSRDQLREAAFGVVCRLLADSPGGAVVDIWVDPSRDRDPVRTGIAVAGASPVLEVLCDVTADVAVRRYGRRRRHSAHLPADQETLTRIRYATAVISPLGLGPAHRVDTSTEVDVPELVRWIDQQMLPT